MKINSYNIILITTLLFLSCTRLAGQDTTTQKKPEQASSALSTGDDEYYDVMVFGVRDKIDPRMSRKVSVALQEARNTNADLVIIDMDTYGGALNDADNIRTEILEFPKPVYVFINKDAASAGALISLACDSIYMASGASIGAATVVTGQGEAAPDKYQSYMRSIMRSTAEANGRDPRIAEAMVDETLEVDSVSPAGKVLTFSTSEAIAYGFCEGQVNNVEEILDGNKITPYRISEFKLGATEQVISFFINPFISGLLILIIIGGIYFELQSPGLGFPILASLVALVLYLVPYYLNGLAENWEIAVFFIGIVLIIVELFVIPGFGVAGISGIVMSISALILMMVNNEVFDFSFVQTEALTKAVIATFGGLLGSIVLMFFGGARLANSKVFQRVSLQSTQNRDDGYTSNFHAEETLVGKTGTAYTVLRPSGKIMIDDEMYDAYTRGEYIDKGTEVKVVSDQGTSLQVRAR